MSDCVAFCLITIVIYCEQEITCVASSTSYVSALTWKLITTYIHHKNLYKQHLFNVKLTNQVLLTFFIS